MLHLLIEDGNSELKHRFFPLGRNIRKHLQATLDNYDGDKTIDGYKRLNNVLSMENGIAYNEMKRIKNFFDNYKGSPDSPEYILNGGDEMHLWVNDTLSRATQQIRDFKETKKEFNIDNNSFKKEHEKDRQLSPGKPTYPRIKVRNGRRSTEGTTIKYENVQRTVRLTEEQARLLTEGVETKNMNAAKDYLRQKMNFTQETALRTIGGIKSKMPNTKLAKCKFMLAMSRYYCEGVLDDDDTRYNLNLALKYIASPSHVNEYNQDLNGMSAKDIIDRFSGVTDTDMEAEKSELSQMQFEQSNYQIVRIPNPYVASEYGQYVEWCITQDESAYVSYTSNFNGLFYFCLREGFEDIDMQTGENTPLDEYGLSMIAVCVNSDGSCSSITCRWNHSNGGNDHILNPKQLSNIIGMNFYEVFKPRPREEALMERKRHIDMMVDEAREMYEIQGGEYDDSFGGYGSIFYGESNEKSMHFLPPDGDSGDRTNKMIIEICGNFQTCLLVDGDTFRPLTYDTFNDIGERICDMIYVQNDKKLWNLINLNGEYVLDNWFNFIMTKNYTIEYGIIAAFHATENAWRFYDTNGKDLLGDCYQCVETLTDDLVELVDYEEGNITKSVFYNLREKRVVKPQRNITKIDVITFWNYPTNKKLFMAQFEGDNFFTFCDSKLNPCSPLKVKNYSKESFDTAGSIASEVELKEISLIDGSTCYIDQNINIYDKQGRLIQKNPMLQTESRIIRLSEKQTKALENMNKNGL